MKTTFSKQEIMPMTVFKNLCYWSKELEMALKHICKSRWICLDLLTCNQIIQILLHSLTTEQTGFHGTWSHMHFHFNNWFYSWDLKIITWLCHFKILLLLKFSLSSTVRHLGRKEKNRYESRNVDKIDHTYACETTLNSSLRLIRTNRFWWIKTYSIDSLS